MTDTTSFDYTPFNQVGRIHTYLAARPKDASEVLSKILSNIAVTILPKYQQEDGEYMSKSDLGYCVVSFDAKSSITSYRITARDGGKVYDCDDLSHVVETILRKWW